MGYEAGADDYITKPFSLSVLLKIEAFPPQTGENGRKDDFGDIVFIAGANESPDKESVKSV